MRTTALAFVLAVTTMSAGLAGCSDNSQEASNIVSEQQARDYRREVESQERIAKANAALPTRPSGIVDVDGATRGSLTAREAARFEAVDNVTQVRVAHNGEDQAFQELCQGDIDLVDSARTISRAEWDACRSVGLDVVQFQMASEAIVVAIKSETDVGGDCLDVNQVEDIYRAGSPVVNWSQVGLDDVPLKVGGPDPDNNAFGFFGRYVLDAPQPSLTNLRSDYAAFANDQGTRLFVVGNNRDWRLSRWYADWTRLRGQQHKRLLDAREELRAARAEVRAALAERAKGIRDQRPPKDKARDQARVDAAYARLVKAKRVLPRVRVRWERLDDRYRVSRRARHRLDLLNGRVAYFRFSYYELFEDQLRPFEITLPDGQRNCIFPSQLTITSGEYPLARQLLITTTTKALERREVNDFLEFYLRHAQRAASDQRLVPLPDESVLIQQRWLSGEEAPVLVSPGTSSERPGSPSATNKPAR
jgi:ABC-type phosphate transport system substrate-binding protein